MDRGDYRGMEASVVRRLHQWEKFAYTLDTQNKVITPITYNTPKIKLKAML